MSSIDDLVRKFKRAVTGAPEPANPEPRLFNWETFPAAPAGAAAPAAAPARSLAAARSAAPAPLPEWKLPPPSPPTSVVGNTIPADVDDFATVYEGAGVSAPEHGYGVDRIYDMLHHKSLEGLDRPVKASAVLAALDAAGVPLQDVVHDAILRYQSLIAFEAAKDLERSGIGPPNAARIEELQAEIAAFRAEKSAEMAELTRQTTEARMTLDRLRARGRAEQERYHRAVSLFVEALPARVIPMSPRASETEAGAGPQGGGNEEGGAEVAPTPFPRPLTAVAASAVREPGPTAAAEGSAAAGGAGESRSGEASAEPVAEPVAAGEAGPERKPE